LHGEERRGESTVIDLGTIANILKGAALFGSCPSVVVSNQRLKNKSKKRQNLNTLKEPADMALKEPADMALYVSSHA
jgi:hypothetical protein